MTKYNNIRLGNLKNLRVKGNKAFKNEANPCMELLASLLQCWSSGAPGSQQCIGAEQALKDCMGKRVRVSKQKPSINYHAARLYPQFGGKSKK